MSNFLKRKQIIVSHNEQKRYFLCDYLSIPWEANFPLILIGPFNSSTEYKYSLQETLGVLTQLSYSQVEEVR